VTVRRGMASVAWAAPALLYVLPLGAALALGLQGAVDASAWRQLFSDSQFSPALRLSLRVGVLSALVSVGVTLLLVTALHGSRVWPRLQRGLGAVLAVPHAAFAVGLALLLMPSGLLARLLATVTGWAAPPDIATVQDPAGFALIVGLVLKEVPFLVWSVAAQLQQVGQGAQITRQLQIAATMGYSTRTTWARVLWPQLLPRLALPLLAVWAYSLTVVDMALVLGPTRPPTLAVLAWQWLLDADETMNRQGAAAALLLTALVGVGALLAVAAMRIVRPALRHRRVRGDRPTQRTGTWFARIGVRFAVVIYAAVLMMLAFVSVAGVWSFPALLPQLWTASAWAVVMHSSATLVLTAALALASAATGVLLAVAWLETTPPHWDRRAAPWVFAPMLVPGVLLVAGLYRLTLGLGLDGHVSGLWLAHSLYTAPYVLVALAPAYRGFDERYAHTAHALGRGTAAFLWHVKWPMLLAPLAAAFAIGFAVSVTQYLTTQFIGAGRFATVTTEALTLASGGQRTLTAAFALTQALLPALVFALALAIARRQARRLGAG
jgi:putative thiamine transport system permease protein